MSCRLCRKFRKEYPLKKGKHIIINITNSDSPKDLPSVSMDPIKCAFDSLDELKRLKKSGQIDRRISIGALFDSDNWNCETMNTLRDLIQDYGYQDRDDNRCASIGVLRIPESDKENIQQGYLVLTWYKDRGRVGRAYVVWDDRKVEVLTLKTARFILNSYNKKGIVK